MVSPYYEASYISIHRQSKGFPRISSLLLRPSRALGFTEPSSIQVLTSKSTSVITALHSTPFSPDTRTISLKEPADHAIGTLTTFTKESSPLTVIHNWLKSKPTLKSTAASSKLLTRL